MSEFWIQTFTGKRFDLLNPTIDMICIEDIAHHLSIENRWHGATKFPISVGYHSVLVAEFVRPEIKLEALLHDAAEAYYKDFANPWKRLMKSCINTNLWEMTFEWIDCLIAEIFQLSRDANVWREIKEIDLRMPITERLALCSKAPEAFRPEYENAIPLNIEFLNLKAENVEQLFLKEYEKWRRI